MGQSASFTPRTFTLGPMGIGVKQYKVGAWIDQWSWPAPLAPHVSRQKTLSRRPKEVPAYGPSGGRYQPTRYRW